AIEAGVGAGGGGHFRVFSDHLDFGQIMAAASFKIVEIVRGGELHDTGAELRVGEIVEDDGNLAVHQRQRDGAAVQVRVARVLRVDGDGRVAEHGLGARGGHGEIGIGQVVDGVADVPEEAGHILVVGFEIADRGAADR